MMMMHQLWRGPAQWGARCCSCAADKRLPSSSRYSELQGWRADGLCAWFCCRSTQQSLRSLTSTRATATCGATTTFRQQLWRAEGGGGRAAAAAAGRAAAGACASSLRGDEVLCVGSTEWQESAPCSVAAGGPVASACWEQACGLWRLDSMWDAVTAQPMACWLLMGWWGGRHQVMQALDVVVLSVWVGCTGFSAAVK